jgi:hypothetical protein
MTNPYGGPVPEPEPPMRCGHCGATNHPGAEWCGQCHVRFPRLPLGMFKPPPPPGWQPPPSEPMSVGRQIGMAVGVLLAVGSLVVVGYAILIVVALSSFSHK